MVAERLVSSATDGRLRTKLFSALSVDTSAWMLQNRDAVSYWICNLETHS